MNPLQALLAYLDRMEDLSVRYIGATRKPNGGHMYRTTGRQSRSIRIRSNNRKAARRAKARRLAA